MTRVLAIMLSFNAKEDSLACLESLAAQDCRELSLLVVDNASQDGAVTAIRERFPAIELLALAENRGWAGGNNAGIAIGLARGFDLICLLNNDLILPPDALSRLTRAALAMGEGLLTPALYFFDAPDRAQLDPPITRHDLGPVAGGPAGESLWQMSFAYGACLMVHASLFAKLGLFDERFFLQLEETDFFHRASQAGYRSLCLASLRVLHKESVSYGAKRAPLKTYYAVRNHLLLTAKHAGREKGLAFFLRLLHWQMRTLHREMGGGRGNLQWLLSDEPHAVASRQGLKDFLLRRFGRIDRRSEARIKVATARHPSKDGDLGGSPPTPVG